jgi:uncharacterized protein (DUF1810 family)
MHPELLLPNFKAACAYLKDPLLAERLLQVSSLATDHLDMGVKPSDLFGKMHHCDFPKFHEAMSMFALAAYLNGDLAQADEFMRGVAACKRDSLEDHVVTALIEERLPGGEAAIAYLTQGQ